MDRRNIIVGAAAIYLDTVADGSTALPAFTGTSYREAMDGSADWRGVGFTQDGLEFATDPSWGGVEVDQLLDDAIIFKDGMSATVSTTFAEATLENLMIAWGQADSTLTESGTGASVEETLVVTGGALGDTPIERQLVAVGPAPRGATGNKYGQRLYHVYRVISAEGASITANRADASTVPVTFRALPDNDGEYAIIRDRKGDYVAGP